MQGNVLTFVEVKYNICRILASASIVFTNRNRPELWIFTPHLVPFYEESHSFSSHLEITGKKKIMYNCRFTWI